MAKQFKHQGVIEASKLFIEDCPFLATMLQNDDIHVIGSKYDKDRGRWVLQCASDTHSVLSNNCCAAIFCVDGGFFKFLRIESIHSI